MHSSVEEPSLAFFRHWPPGLQQKDDLLSSLQSFETSLFLIGLRRYPHALLTSVSSLESALLSADIGATEQDKLGKRLDKAAAHSPTIARSRYLTAPHKRFEELRTTRNRIAHRGFGLRDHSVSVSLLLDVAIPLLAACYKDLHAFDLLNGLIVEVAEHIQVAIDTHALAVSESSPDLAYSASSLAHLVSYSIKDSFASNWEVANLVHDMETGGDFKPRADERSRLQQLLEPYWELDCRICQESKAVVGELAFDGDDIALGRTACTSCSFVTSSTERLLAKILYGAQLDRARTQIRSEYGLS